MYDVFRDNQTKSYSTCVHFFLVIYETEQFKKFPLIFLFNAYSGVNYFDFKEVVL